MKKTTFTATNDYPNARNTPPDYDTRRKNHVLQNRKEDNYFHGIKAVAHIKGEIHTLIDVRFYATRPGFRRIYCCIWLSIPSNKRYPDGIYVSGGGSAGGHGYCRKSAAMANALEDAGAELSWGLSGTGQFNEALKDVCTAAGFKKISIITCHG
jgi:hypothetical protein